MLLAFDDDGPGPVVVLLHGFPFDRTMWSHQRSSVGAVYRVITPDLRGHGTSAAPDGVYTVDDMADDVIETLDALQLTGPVALGGLSMGGYVALSIVDRYPERVGSLLLMSTRAGADTPEAAATRVKHAEEIEASGDTEPFVTGFLPKVFSRHTFEHHPGVISTLHHHMSRMVPRAVAGTLRGLAARPDRSASLGRIEVPTLVLAGADDAIIPAEESEALARGIPHARREVIPHAGHLPPVENHAATDAAILGFLESLW